MENLDAKSWTPPHGVKLPESLMLRGGEVAQALGISRALAYRWMAMGILPTVKVRSAVRVPRAALLAWIEKNTRQAA